MKRFRHPDRLKEELVNHFMDFDRRPIGERNELMRQEEVRAGRIEGPSGRTKTEKGRRSERG